MRGLIRCADNFIEDTQYLLEVYAAWRQVVDGVLAVIEMQTPGASVCTSHAAVYSTMLLKEWWPSSTSTLGARSGRAGEVRQRHAPVGILSVVEGGRTACSTSNVQCVVHASA